MRGLAGLVGVDNLESRATASRITEAFVGNHSSVNLGGADLTANATTNTGAPLTRLRGWASAARSGARRAVELNAAQHGVAQRTAGRPVEVDLDGHSWRHRDAPGALWPRR